MFEQYDGYDTYRGNDYNQPLDLCFNPYLEELQDSRPAEDDLPETITRYGAFFCIGIFITLVVRLFAELQPLFWILAIAGLIALGLAIRFTQRWELIAIAAIVGAALLAGHWDYLAHGARTAVDAAGEAIGK